MTRRTYAQHCGLAVALDALGERWTLLLVRELLGGARRFSDLQDGLPGIGTALLTQRLRDLEATGIVERVRLPRPASGTAYALTAEGRELEPVVLGLATWGARRLGPPDDDRAFRARWAMLAMRTRFAPEAAAGLRAAFAFRVDEEAFTALVRDGTLEVHDGVLPGADVVVTADGPTFAAVAADPRATPDALADGRLRIDGDAALAARLGALFPVPG